MTALSPAPGPSPFYLSVAGRTDVGHVRGNNEDAFVIADLTGGALLGAEAHARFDVGERGVLLAVSDGMGGAPSGEVASALVCETLTRALADASPDAPRDALMNDAIQRAHRAVWDLGKRDSQRMGATLTAVFVHAGDAYIAEVGDSRAYLVRGGKITRLTHDQSMVQLLLDEGVLQPDEIDHSPLRNVILQAMGHQRDVQVALAKLELRKHDCLVLCSDGLTRHLSDEEILRVVLEMGRPNDIAGRLVDLANERGGEDNITVVVAGAGGDLAEPRASEPDLATLEVLTAYDQHAPKTK